MTTGTLLRKAGRSRIMRKLTNYFMVILAHDELAALIVCTLFSVARGSVFHNGFLIEVM